MLLFTFYYSFPYSLHIKKRAKVLNYPANQVWEPIRVIAEALLKTAMTRCLNDMDPSDVRTQPTNRNPLENSPYFELVSRDKLASEDAERYQFAFVPVWNPTQKLRQPARK
jgi:hypothetical protein